MTQTPWTGSTTPSSRLRVLNGNPDDPDAEEICVLSERFRERHLRWECASRIYLGAHWMTDVLGGYALGATWVAAVVIVALVTSPRGTSGADPAGERASCGRRGNRRSERPGS